MTIEHITLKTATTKIIKLGLHENALSQVGIEKVLIRGKEKTYSNNSLGQYKASLIATLQERYPLFAGHLVKQADGTLHLNIDSKNPNPITFQHTRIYGSLHRTTNGSLSTDDMARYMPKNHSEKKDEDHPLLQFHLVETDKEVFFFIRAKWHLVDDGTLRNLEHDTCYHIKHGNWNDCPKPLSDVSEINKRIQEKARKAFHAKNKPPYLRDIFTPLNELRTALSGLYTILFTIPFFEAPVLLQFKQSEVNKTCAKANVIATENKHYKPITSSKSEKKPVNVSTHSVLDALNLLFAITNWKVFLPNLIRATLLTPFNWKNGEWQGFHYDEMISRTALNFNNLLTNENEPLGIVTFSNATAYPGLALRIDDIRKIFKKQGLAGVSVLMAERSYHYNMKVHSEGFIKNMHQMVQQAKAEGKQNNLHYISKWFESLNFCRIVSVSSSWATTKRNNFKQGYEINGLSNPEQDKLRQFNAAGVPLALNHPINLAYYMVVGGKHVAQLTLQALLLPQWVALGRKTGLYKVHAQSNFFGGLIKEGDALTLNTARAITANRVIAATAGMYTLYSLLKSIVSLASNLIAIVAVNRVTNSLLPQATEFSGLLGSLGTLGIALTLFLLSRVNLIRHHIAYRSNQYNLQRDGEILNTQTRGSCS